MELKPCPFCGSAAVVIYDYQDTPKSAQCANHGKRKKLDRRCYMSHQFMPIAEWNNRVEPEPDARAQLKARVVAELESLRDSGNF